MANIDETCVNALNLKNLQGYSQHLSFKNVILISKHELFAAIEMSTFDF